MNENAISNKLKGDGIIWMVFFFLCIISIIEVYSASSGLTYKGGYYWGPALKHTSFLLIGVCFMVGVMNIKCKYFKIITPFALLLSMIMLIMVLVSGHAENDATRWLSLFGIKFQPSELAKGSLILAEAQILSAMQTKDGADPRAFRFILFISIPTIMLIFFENFSTAFLLGTVVVMMMIIGRVPGKQIGRLVGIVVLAGAMAVAAVMIFGTDKQKEKNSTTNTVLVENADKNAKKSEKSALSKVTHRFDTWKTRIDKFIDNEYVAPNDYDLDNDAQVAHANIAIVSSNIVGKGPGNSVERDFLSQAFSDFIYAIVIEEMGILGAFVVCMLYIILLFRTAIIANRCANTFPALLIMGFALLLVTQAMFNMAVAVGLAPVTGQPLPLISKGGTSTIMNCVYIGIILSVSYSAKKNDSTESNTPVTVKAKTA
ncbi:FtsW/RodA/SpoVE family cell cycle protein [Prevotella sp. PCHR]|uniref:Probable peptidoglycan glycosyltransferase FtsW n=1 Tax=Xylanibacter caecicola TaxID=2736294 RepID=A0ABX2AY64_9BACT|nr:FtsW/RodA/SpoVE family cell cycle protein [Xylanibacter caecicola]NPE24057.1 FtsW/RodA/SpoVE family cell cycle protein [Xylanibacter caecicola]